MKYLLVISIIFLSSDSIKVDSTSIKKEVNQCEYVHQQNKQCIKELDVKWQIIEKLIKQKIQNNK